MVTAEKALTNGHMTTELAVTAKPYRKVAILGSADSSLSLAPVADPSWERWGLAWTHPIGQFNITRYFDPHELKWMVGRHENYVEHLNKLAPIPVYMLEAYPEVKNAIRIPIEAILTEFVGYKNLPKGSFASSIAYMLALAIHEGVQEIGLWGIDLLTEGEYAIQRPNVEYLLGVAEGRGIKLHIPSPSALLKGNLSYGYQLTPDTMTGITYQYMRERKLKYERNKQGALSEAQTYDGALQEARRLLEIEDLKSVWPKIEERVKEYDTKRKDALARAQTFDGALQEADALMTQLKHWERGGVIAGNGLGD